MFIEHAPGSQEWLVDAITDGLRSGEHRYVAKVLADAIWRHTERVDNEHVKDVLHAGREALRGAHEECAVLCETMAKLATSFEAAEALKDAAARIRNRGGLNERSF